MGIIILQKYYALLGTIFFQKKEEPLAASGGQASVKKYHSELAMWIDHLRPPLQNNNYYPQQAGDIDVEPSVKDRAELPKNNNANKENDSLLTKFKEEMDEDFKKLDRDVTELKTKLPASITKVRKGLNKAIKATEPPLTMPLSTPKKVPPQPQAFNSSDTTSSNPPVIEDFENSLYYSALDNISGSDSDEDEFFSMSSDEDEGFSDLTSPQHNSSKDKGHFSSRKKDDFIQQFSNHVKADE